MRGQLSLSFWIILTLVLVLVVGTIIYLNSPVDVPVVSNVSVNVTQNFSVFVGSNFPVDYSLSNGSGFFVKGVLRDGVLDSVSFVPNGSLLNLSGWGTMYYSNSSMCNVSVDGQVCSVSVFRKADFSVSLTNRYVDIIFSDGVVQSPIVCFAWSYLVDNVLMDFPVVDIPLILRRKVDACFLLPTIYSSSSFLFDVHWNSLYPSGDTFLKVFVYDFEREGFVNVGLRNASIVLNRNI